VQCLSCDSLIKVGKGGLQNLLKQHKPGESKACKLNLKKKNKASAHQQSQPGLLSYFPKKPKVLVPPAIPMPTPIVAYAIDPASQCFKTHVTRIAPIIPPPVPNMHAINLLTMLEKVVENIPVLSDASESDKIAVFSESVPTDLVKEDAWEYLDLILNHFLGFSKMEECIYKDLWGGMIGLLAIV